MGYKTVIVNDLICDHCGKTFVNKDRSANEVLISKAIKENWKLDNNGKMYCPDCLNSTISIEIKYHWPYFYRMSCCEYSIKNSGGNNPIQSVFDKDNKLHIIIESDKLDNFTQMDWRWAMDLDLDEFRKTSSNITIVYPDIEIVYSKLICEDHSNYNGVDEFVFSYKDKITNTY